MAVVPPGLGWHLIGMIAVLMLCLLAPRSGQPVLLVPAGFRAEQPLKVILARHGLDLIAPGRLSGTWVVRPRVGAADWSLLTDGVVPITVPVLFCGAPQPRTEPIVS